MNINLTLIGQSIAFIFFVLFCMKYVWPFITDAMAAKTLREAKQEAAGIVESANKRAAKLVEEAKDQARVEAERIRSAAEAEVEQEVNRAKEKLRGQVSQLALLGAQKVLEAEIDESKHKSMIDKLAANL